MGNFWQYICLLVMLNSKLVKSDLVPLIRYYNSALVDDFYTTSFKEIKNGNYGWKYEEVQGYIHSTQVGNTVPLYRYYGNTDHFYTTDINEIGTATHGEMGKLGYTSEGVVGYCRTRPWSLLPRVKRWWVELYRYYSIENKNHFYTTSREEGDARPSYHYERIACYVHRVTEYMLAPLYRYYNSANVDHFYTVDFDELGSGRLGYQYEGIECFIYPSQSRSDWFSEQKPLYRYWGNTDHFYTTNRDEIGRTINGEVGNYGYKSEGIAGYCYPTYRDGFVPLYRYYSSEGSNHFYTTTNYGASFRSLNGMDYLKYDYERVACYVYI